MEHKFFADKNSDLQNTVARHHFKWTACCLSNQLRVTRIVRSKEGGTQGRKTLNSVVIRQWFWSVITTDKRTQSRRNLNRFDASVGGDDKTENLNDVMSFVMKECDVTCFMDVGRTSSYSSPHSSLTQTQFSCGLCKAHRSENLCVRTFYRLYLTECLS